MKAMVLVPIIAERTKETSPDDDADARIIKENDLAGFVLCRRLPRNPNDPSCRVK